jgi:carboxypeptidase Taq
MADRLEVTPASDVEGCLQDVHWALGLFGYFPSYATGGVMAAQLFESLRTHTPDIEERLARGDFTSVTGWLSTNVHAYGSRLTLQELVKQATGKPLAATAALRYLEGKYLGTAQ